MGNRQRGIEEVVVTMGRCKQADQRAHELAGEAGDNHVTANWGLCTRARDLAHPSQLTSRIVPTSQVTS